MNNVLSTTMDNSLVYTDSYVISQLNTTDDGRVIQCEVVINASQSVMANDSFTLDVIDIVMYILITHYYYSTHSSHSYSHHITIWSHTRSYGG